MSDEETQELEATVEDNDAEPLQSFDAMVSADVLQSVPVTLSVEVEIGRAHV